jgi:glucose/mannose-6-phosphate isomerase
MRGLIAALPRQLAASADLAGLADLAPPSVPPARVVLCGMGGSAIAGDLLRPLLTGTQLVVHRDYGLPPWAGPRDLVVASSYSGGTEETLSGWHAAGDRGCPRLVLTTGGELGRLAAAAGVPTVVLPADLPPRAALGYGIGGLARVLARLGCLADGDARLTAAVRELERLTEVRLDAAGPDGEDGAGNPHPRRAAADLLDADAVIHTAGDEAHAAGRRLQAQLNENAKVPARWGAFPELNHNELVGWGPAPGPVGRRVLILLRGAELTSRLARRVAITGDLLAETFPVRHEVRASGADALARIMSLVQYGDALSWHLADLRGVDPVPVTLIEQLKQALADPEEQS